MHSSYGKLRIHRLWQEPTGQASFAVLLHPKILLLVLVFEESFHFYQFSSMFYNFCILELCNLLVVSVGKVK